MRRKKKKGGNMLKKIGVVVLVLIVALAVIAYFAGMFKSVTIKVGTTGPYQIVCLDHIGPYKNIAKKIQSVEKLLAERKIKPVAACGIYYDNPKVVSSDKLRSKGGCIVKGDLKLDILEEIEIPKRKVVIAKIKAHPAVAPIKTYPKIEKWMKDNSYSFDGPCLEIYHSNGIVEVQAPIAPVVKEKAKKELEKKEQAEK